VSRQSDKPTADDTTPAQCLTLDAIAKRLVTLDAGQAAMNTALGLMLDTLHAQTTLLRKLAEFAADDSAPSPLLKTLQDLTSAIMQLDASVGDVERKFDQLAQLLVLTVAPVDGATAVVWPRPDEPPSSRANEEGG